MGNPMVNRRIRNIFKSQQEKFRARLKISDALLIKCCKKFFRESLNFSSHKILKNRIYFDMKTHENASNNPMKSFIIEK